MLDITKNQSLSEYAMIHTEQNAILVKMKRKK